MWDPRSLILRVVLVIAAFCTNATVLAQSAPDGSSQAPPAASQSDYIIGPGDILQIFVWRNPELGTTVPVRPDGRISTPLVEDMVAVGKSPAQLARDIEGVLAEFVRSPTVNIIVTTAVGALSQVKVIGQVRAPQSVPYRNGLRVLDAVLQAGGLTDFAAPNRTKLVRNPRDGGKAKEIRIRLGDLLEKGDVKQNLVLEPGDLLVIPQARF